MSGTVAAAPIAPSPLPICHFSSPVSSLSEADLARLWQDQSFPAGALTTRDGHPLRVIYRGRCTGGPGPDFRDAVIAAPNGLLRGDVELHVRSSDFRRHGHDRDSAYDGVVLHVVFSEDEGRSETTLAGGRTAPVAALGDWVEGRSREIQSWLERPGHWQEPCFSAVTRRGTDAVAATLDQLGDMRFRQKTVAISRRLRSEEAEDVLWREMLHALAYGSDRPAFQRLAGRLPWRRLRSAIKALPAAERAPKALHLLSAAAGTIAGGSRPSRPANRPQARLEGAARLAARFAPAGILAAFAPHLEAASEASLSVLANALVVPGAVGAGKAREILANAVLPLFAALGPETRARRAEAHFGRLPLSARYGAVRHLHEAVGQDVPIGFRRQQGMLYLLKQYCTQGGCGRCPLS